MSAVKKFVPVVERTVGQKLKDRVMTTAAKRHINNAKIMSNAQLQQTMKNGQTIEVAVKPGDTVVIPDYGGMALLFDQEATSSISESASQEVTAPASESTKLPAFLDQVDTFPKRHVGPNPREIQEMCGTLNVRDMDHLMEETIPAHIRRPLTEEMLQAPGTRSESEVLAELKEKMSMNTMGADGKVFLGQGYHGTIVPQAIARNLYSNPGWYTAYTPYQPEIAQGRLESLLNFQTLCSELTGMDLANASLLDEGTAAAEALGMFLSLSNRKAKTHFFVSDTVHPQTLGVMKTRAKYLGVELITGKTDEFFGKSNDFANLLGALVQYPDTFGKLRDFSDVAEELHQAKGFLCVAADPLNLMLAKTPAEMGADVTVGSTQRFGVPMFSGGPAAAYFATHKKHLRKMPGRIIGETIDSCGNKAYRLTLQTREQHIRLDKATSNVCTAQALLANASSMYAIYHGKDGLKQIARKVHGLAQAFSYACTADLNLRVWEHCKVTEAGDAEGAAYFDQVCVDVAPMNAYDLATKLENDHGVFVRQMGQSSIAVSFDETHTLQDTQALVEAMRMELSLPQDWDHAAAQNRSSHITGELPSAFTRDDINPTTGKPFLNQKIFNSIQSETEMMRYIKRLENKDLSLVHSMITLGSCTMKLNSASSLTPILWPEVANVHPFAPNSSVQGYRKMLHELEQYLCKITAMDACSLQPTSGAAGEYAGLVAIKRYHASTGFVGEDRQKNVVIIPKSAHGTNPASAAMAGMEIRWIDDNNGMPLEELKRICQELDANNGTNGVPGKNQRLAALMITYPSTHGVFEQDITEVIDTVHKHGGMVYMDGANMNAHLGLTAPGKCGADVCHLNLHKTFSIPHGGGGPGMGPICVNEKLAPYLPGHVGFQSGGAVDITEGAVSAAPYGQAGIAAIPWMFISMLGAEGLTMSAQASILNANYMKTRLEDHYTVRSCNASGKNPQDRCSHEFIVDISDLRKETGITEEDIAKRLQDYGFHAPTMSWPVPHSLMIEPTESEDKGELDRFVDALISIRGEIKKVATGEYDREDNPLKNAPHTIEMVMGTANDPEGAPRTLPYSPEVSAFPLPYIAERGKFWPTVGRVNNAYGDKHTTVKLDA